MTTTRRLFVGLTPPAPVRDAIVAACAHWAWPPGAALARPDQLHITLAFLGNVDASRVDALAQALSAIETPPFTLQLADHELWHRGIAVLLPRENDVMNALQSSVSDVVASQGLAAEAHAWKPHLTLARKAAHARPPVAATTAVSWDVAGFDLLWSRLPPGVPQPVYEAVASFGLCAA